MADKVDTIAIAAGERCVCVGGISEPGRLFQISLVDESPDSELCVVETEPVPFREIHFFAWPDERTAEAINEIAWDCLDAPNRCQGISISAEVEAQLKPSVEGADHA